jgi:hypothetical protein
MIHHGSHQSTMVIYTALTPTVVQLEKKSCITAYNDPLRCEIATRDVPGRYPSMVDQTNRQGHTKSHHSPWLKSEYHGDI